MKDADAKAEKPVEKKELTPEEKAKEALALLYAGPRLLSSLHHSEASYLFVDLKSHVSDLEKTAATKEMRFLARVLRRLKNTGSA